MGEAAKSLYQRVLGSNSDSDKNENTKNFFHLLVKSPWLS